MTPPSQPQNFELRNFRGEEGTKGIRYPVGIACDHVIYLMRKLIRLKIASSNFFYLNHGRQSTNYEYRTNNNSFFSVF